MPLFTPALILASTLSAALPPAVPGQMPVVVLSPEPPAPLKSFEEVVKDAKRYPGLFELWQREDKVWLEVRPDQLGALFFMSWTFPRGIGERGFYGGMMGDSHLVYFKRIGNTLQLLARNNAFMAQAGSPLAHAVANGFSDSLLASAVVASLPQAQGKGFLVEANALLMRDLPMATLDLDAAFHQGYAFDAANSSFAGLDAASDHATLLVNAHFAMNKPVLSATASLPETLEDPRSLFLGFQYTFAQLPAVPMTPRAADDRVGHFVTTRWDFSSDLKPDPRLRLVNRWRLEKADPAAPLSPPREPIVFCLDRNIPLAYRATVKAAILEWNKAFERIGFRDAIEVVAQPEDAEWTPHGAHHASLRWFLGVDGGFAIGPSLVDPRTGEILDADIAIGELFARSMHEAFQEEVPPAARAGGRNLCAFLAGARREAAFGLDLLRARNVLEPGSPEEQAFVLGYLKAVVMHEVGHTLGLRHNFRASTAYTQAQLGDRAFTAAHGIAGSVMDYLPVNLAPAGAPQGAYTMPTLGPYDYWAIEYAYAPLEPATEKARLAQLAARGEGEPTLAYATDEEAGSGWQAMDPEVNRFDLGQDPLAFLTRRLALSHELLSRLQARVPRPGDDYTRLRRDTQLALYQMGSAAVNAAKYLGGVVYVRDHAGSPRAPLVPVSGARQRDALDLITSGIFGMDALRLKPEFVSRLTVDQFDRGDGSGSAPDFSVSDQILAIQKAILARVLNPAAMHRILDAPEKTGGEDAFRLSELFDGIHDAIWEEARAGQEPTATRRGLQKEHVRELAALVLKPSPAAPDDARALAREDLQTLRNELHATGRMRTFTRETRAHFAECLATIDGVLKAYVQRLTS